jgi:hypothetical protein
MMKYGLVGRWRKMVCCIQKSKTTICVCVWMCVCACVCVCVCVCVLCVFITFFYHETFNISSQITTVRNMGSTNHLMCNSKNPPDPC